MSNMIRDLSVATMCNISISSPIGDVLPKPLQVFRIRLALSMWLTALLSLLDLLAIISGLLLVMQLMPSTPVLILLSIVVAGMFVMVLQAAGRFNVAFCSDFAAPIWQAILTCVAWLVIVAPFTWLNGSDTWCAGLLGTGLIGLISVMGRVVFTVIVVALRDRLIERVLLVGVPGVVERQARTLRLQKYHVHYIGACLAVDARSDRRFSAPVALDDDGTVISYTNPVLIRDVDRIAIILAGLSSSDLLAALKYVSEFGPTVDLL